MWQFQTEKAPEDWRTPRRTPCQRCLENAASRGSAAPPVDRSGKETEGRSRGRCLNSAWGCWTGDILLPKPGRCDTAGFHVQVLRLASCFRSMSSLAKMTEIIART